MTVTDHRDSSSADCRVLAQGHIRAFPGFFLSTLGADALAAFYEATSKDESSVGLVIRDGALQPIGAAVGTVKASGHLSRLVRRSPLLFIRAGLTVTTRTPQRSFQAAQRFFEQGPEVTSDYPAILSSIFVSPEWRGAGSRLLTAWERQLFQRTTNGAHLLTDADDNTPALRFYDKHGWTRDRLHVTREGRRMLVLVKANPYH